MTKPVDAKDWADTRFLAALAPAYQTQKVEEPKVAAKAPSASDRAIINKQIQIHFTPNSDEIMPGSYFVLDALGETMTSFGNTYLRVEGNTDATGKASANMQLSERRALAVKNYVLKNFPNIEAGPLPDDRARLGEPGRRQRDRDGPPAQPPDRHQGRPGDAVRRGRGPRPPRPPARRTAE